MNRNDHRIENARFFLFQQTENVDFTAKRKKIGKEHAQIENLGECKKKLG